MHLECRDISYKYPHSEKYVLKNLNFEMCEPGFNALFGPSGVGKTSLARIISGALKGYCGQIRTEAMSHLLYSYNLERLPGWSSVGRHVDKITPQAKRSIKDELIDAFGMKSCLGSRFSQLSLGQRNRINLIRYLLQDFQLLIMDESLANVDELTREKIILKIKTMFPEAFFLYISHNVVEVSKFCKQILVFRSVHKQPQTMLVSGQDVKTDQSLDSGAMDRTMLEIVNAA